MCEVQIEIGCSTGVWRNDLQQLKMDGFSDAHKIFHPSVLSIQKAEGGLGSTKIPTFWANL